MALDKNEEADNEAYKLFDKYPSRYPSLLVYVCPNWCRHTYFDVHHQNPAFADPNQIHIDDFGM